MARTYYCWIKITPDGAEQPLPQVRVHSEASDAGSPSVMRTLLMYELSGQMVGPATIRSPDRPPRAGGLLVQGWWSLDRSMGSPDGAKVDLMPVFGERDQAIEWIASETGKAWLKGAQYHFLMCFTDAGL